MAFVKIKGQPLKWVHKETLETAQKQFAEKTKAAAVKEKGNEKSS
jgi:hypothetical protein